MCNQHHNPASRRNSGTGRNKIENTRRIAQIVSIIDIRLVRTEFRLYLPVIRLPVGRICHTFLGRLDIYQINIEIVSKRSHRLDGKHLLHAELHNLLGNTVDSIAGVIETVAKNKHIDTVPFAMRLVNFKITIGVILGMQRTVGIVKRKKISGSLRSQRLAHLVFFHIGTQLSPYIHGESHKTAATDIQSNAFGRKIHKTRRNISTQETLTYREICKTR